MLFEIAEAEKISDSSKTSRRLILQLTTDGTLQLFLVKTAPVKHRLLRLLLGVFTVKRTSTTQSFSAKPLQLTCFQAKKKTVRAEISLTHSGTDYTIISEQRYKKNETGVQSVGQRKFGIAYKGKGWAAGICSGDSI